jgi:O-antigen ligase
VWSILLLGVALLMQNAIVTQMTLSRGVPRGFVPPIAEADGPCLGVNVALEQYDGLALDAALTSIEEGGFTWVRQSFYWSEVASTQEEYDWTLPDRIVAAMAHHPHLQLVAVLDGVPGEPLVDPERFADFAGAFAARYRHQVDYYQVWDEPNLADHWGGGPINPAAYADLLARTTRAIRLSDPGARVLLAGLAPTVEVGPQNLNDVRYLDQLYQAGAAPYFDIAAGKPYGFYTGPDDRRVGEAILNFSRLILLRQVMVEHGDADKALWATHWGWNALPPDWAGAPSVWGQTDEATRVVYTIGALERARAEWPWAGAMILEHFEPDTDRRDPHWGFALVDQTPRPTYDAVIGWAASLPDAAPVGGHAAENRWATYRGAWHLGDLGADVRSESAQSAFRFDGSAVALTVRRGPYRAFLYVTVDGKPADALPRDKGGRAYVVLYDAEPEIATIPLATDLSPGPHVVEIVTEGGQGQWMLVDWRVGTGDVPGDLCWQVIGFGALALVLAAALVHDLWRLNWAAMRAAFLAWPIWGQMALLVSMVTLLWIAAGMSWGLDWGNPWLVISLAALSVLAVLFSWRLDLGLAIVAAAAPFYGHPQSMFYGGLSLPGALIISCWIGISSRGGLRRRNRWTFSRLDGAVVCLTLSAAVSSLVAADLPASLFEFQAVFLLPALYYGLLRVALRSDNGWRLGDGLVVGACGVALIGLVQYVLGHNVAIAEGGLPRLQSVYASPNNVGLYLGRVWPILLAVAFWGERGRRRLFYIVALLPVMLALFLSFSRGALLLGIPAGLLLMGWRVGGKWRWTTLVLIGVGGLMMIPLLRVPRFASLLDLDRGGTFFRLELWQSSLTMLREHFWFGVGPGNFLNAYRTRYVLPSAWQEFNLEHPHSIYLDHWTRLGVWGVMAGLWGQFAFWRAAWKGSRPDALTLGLTGSMAVLLAHGLVDNALFFPDLALTFFLLLALAQQTGRTSHCAA